MRIDMHEKIQSDSPSKLATRCRRKEKWFRGKQSSSPTSLLSEPFLKFHELRDDLFQKQTI